MNRCAFIDGQIARATDHRRGRLHRIAVQHNVFKGHIAAAGKERHTGKVIGSGDDRERSLAGEALHRRLDRQVEVAGDLHGIRRGHDVIRQHFHFCGLADNFRIDIFHHAAQGVEIMIADLADRLRAVGQIELRLVA